jgi:hypothetical protein
MSACPHCGSDVSARDITDYDAALIFSHQLAQLQRDMFALRGENGALRFALRKSASAMRFALNGWSKQSADAVFDALRHADALQDT